MTLTQEGRHLVNDDPEMVLHAAQSSDLPDVHCMGLYAVLGDCLLYTSDAADE